MVEKLKSICIALDILKFFSRLSISVLLEANFAFIREIATEDEVEEFYDSFKIGTEFLGENEPRVYFVKCYC